MDTNMKEWLKGLIDSDSCSAIPILSFPSVDLSGITVGKLISDSDAQAQGMAAIAQRCDSAASVSMMDLSVEAECFGADIHFSDNEVPTVLGKLITSEDDLEKLSVPKVGDGRTGIYVEAIAKAKELIKDRPVLAGVIGPYSLAGRLMGVSEIMINCLVEPDLVHQVLKRTNDFLRDYIKAYKDAGADGVVVAEPAAGLLSPEMCKEFSCDYLSTIVEELQDENFLIMYHNCGNAVSHMVPELLSMGCAAYHFGNAIDMEEMLQQMPEDVPVMGNLDPVGVLRNGTPESVRQATLDLMEKCCKHKNFVVSSGCDMPPGTPWSNIDAFFAAVAEFNEK